LLEIQQLWRERKAIVGPKLVKRSLLRGSHATGASHKAANAASIFDACHVASAQGRSFLLPCLSRIRKTSE
jgi:hypothetical protein